MGRIAVILTWLAAGVAAFGSAQAAPTISAAPTAAPAGDTVEVKGFDFGAGEVGIHLDVVEPESPLATTVVGRDGSFIVRFSVPRLTPGPHLLLACRDVQRGGDCRELAETPFEILVTPTTTTTTTPRATTTTPGTTTTTAPRATTTTPRATTTTPRATTTTAPRATTTTPRATTTTPRATTTTKPRATTTPPMTIVTTPPRTTPPRTTTTLPAIGVFETTTTPPPTAVLATTTTEAIDTLSGPSTTLGGDVVPPPAPPIGIVTTTQAPAFGTNIEPDEIDLTLTGIEVTQGLQNLANDFPLVANRPTAVRLFGTSAGDYNGLASGFLEVSRGGVVLGTIGAENNPVQFGSVPIRYDNDFAPYFLLEPSWTDPGIVTFRGAVIAGDPTLANDLDPIDNEIEVTLEFHESEPVWVDMYPLYLTDNGTSSGGVPTIHMPADGWAVQALNTARLWPVAHMVFNPQNTVLGSEGIGWDLTEDGSLSDPFELLALTHLVNHGPDFSPFSERVLTMGMVSPDVPTEFGGGAQSPGKVSWTKMYDTWDGTWPWHNRAAAIMAQELAHNAGLQHAPCDYTPGDPLPGELHGGAIDPDFPQSYSWPNCSIAPQDPEGFYGFDVQFGFTPTDEPSVMTNDAESDPPLNAVPFMSYAGQGKWLEPWHGCQLLVWVGVPCDPYELIDIEPGTPGQGQGAPNPASGVPVWSCDSWNGPFSDDDGLCDLMPTQPFDPVPLDDADSDIVVIGHVDPVLGTADVSVGWEIEQWHAESYAIGATEGEDGSALALRDFGEDYFLVLLDGDSKVLGAQSIDVRSAVGTGHDDEPDNPLVDHPPELGQATVAMRLPKLAGLERIAIVSEAGVLADLAPGSSIPAIDDFELALDGETANVSWSASDPDGDPLSALIRFGPDGDRRTIAAPRHAGSEWVEAITLDLSSLPGGIPGRLELIVTDGIHQAKELSEPIQLPDRSPNAVIIAPVTGSTRAGGAMVLLQAAAIDPEDGIDVAIDWSSDLDGDLGDGTALGLRDLSTGRHRITMTAMDLAGNTTVDSIEITIGATDPDAIALTAAVADLFENGPTVREQPAGSRWPMIALLAALAASAGLLGYLLVDRRRTREV